MWTDSVEVGRRARAGTLGLLCAAVLAAGCGRQDPGAAWPQWRGPGGLGISSSAELPVQWGEGQGGIRWSTPINGGGTSSPIATTERVYLTSARDAGNQVALQVHGFDLDSGEELWTTTVARRPREKTHRMSTSAGPTPVTDGRHVFAYFGSHLAALESGGETVWTQEIDPSYLEESRYAAGSSLVLAGDLVIVLRERERVAEHLAGWIAAFDKRTGALAWKKEWDDSCCSYVTPLVMAGGRELFVVLAGYVVSLDSQTGEILRRENQGISQPVASPVVEDDLICVASGAHANRRAMCWQSVEENGDTVWKPLWTLGKWVPDTSSPILMNGRLYLLTEMGILRCLEARTGEIVWQKRLEGAGYRASLVAGAGKLYATDESGTMSVISADEGEVLAVNQMPAGSYLASPAIASDCLVVRSDSHLYCVDGV